MKVPDNFILILLAAACLVGRHWLPELDPLALLLLSWLRPGESIIPSRSEATASPPTPKTSASLGGEATEPSASSGG